MDGLNPARPAPPPGFEYQHADDQSPASAPSMPVAVPTLTRSSVAPSAPSAPVGASVLSRPAAPAGFSYDAPAIDLPKAVPKDNGYVILDVPKALAGGVVHGVGATVRGVGEALDTLNPLSAVSRSLMSDDTPQWIKRPGTALGDFIGSPIENAGGWIKGSESDKAKAVQEAPLVEGRILDPQSWKFGEGASSPMNWTLKGADMVGNLAPMVIGSEATAARALSRAPGMTADILAAVRAGKVAELAPEAQQVAQAALTRSGRSSVAAGAATGGVQGAEDAAQGESERVRQMSTADLEQLPAYSSMIARGMKPDDARTALADQVRSRVFATTLPVATAAGAITTAPLLHEAQGTLAKVVGESALRRAGAGAALEAPVQGAIAVGQAAAQTAASNSATGESRDPLQDSLATFGAGALPGAAFGGLGGLHRPVPGSLTEAATLTRAATAGKDDRVAPSPTSTERSLSDEVTSPSADAGDTRPVATLASGATPGPIDPIVPPWVDPDTGEVGVPSKDDLVGAIAQQMRAQYDAAGHLRINSNALAKAWGVDPSDVKRARQPAQRQALDEIAASERAPAAAAAIAPNSVADSDAATGVRAPSESDTSATGPVDAETDGRVGATQDPGDLQRSFDDIERDMNAGLDASRDRLSAALGEKPVSEPPATDGQLRPNAERPAENVDEAPGSLDAPVDPVDGGGAIEEPQRQTGAKETGEPNGGVAPHATEGGDTPIPEDGSPTPKASSEGEDGANPPPSGAKPVETGSTEPETSSNAADRVPAVTARVPGTVLERSDAAGTRAVIPEPTAAAKRADSVRVKTPEGEMNGKRFVDNRVANGFTRVESVRMGDKMVHRLVNDAGEKTPLPAGVLPYAQEAVAATRVAPKDSTARNADGREPAKVPDANAVAARDGAAPAHPVDVAAAEAATSPHNDRPEPTQAQKEAGNYKMGHVQIHGLDVSIENPRGSVRSGVDASGTPWSHAMSDHYGYVRGTVGADGDHVDVYVGPKPEARRVFVVDQIHQDTGKFDEHKAMMGFASKRDALAAYRSNFDKSWKVGPVRDFTMNQFKDWLKSGDTKRPASDVALTPANSDKAPAVPTAPAPKAPAVAARRGGIATNGARVRVAGGKLEYVPRAKETLEAYFKPGRVVKSYGGHDRVEAFDWNGGNWSVKVHEVKADGSDLPDPSGRAVHQRAHGTAPDPREIVRVLGKPELADAEARAPSKAALKSSELLGAKAGDVIRSVRTGAEIQPGSTWRVESIRADGTVEVREASGGGTAKFSGKALQREVNAGARFENLSKAEAGGGRAPEQAGNAREFRLAGEDSRGERLESEAPTTQQQAHAERVTQIAGETTKAWRGGDVPKVEVVATPEQLPRTAKFDPVTGQPDPRYKRARGLYDGRTVWLVASAHADTPAGRSQIARTLAHEAVGHYGIDRIVHRELGADAWKAIETSVARLEREGAGGKPVQDVLADVRRRYGDVDAATFARETLAVMAERGVQSGLLDRVVAAVRSFLRKALPHLDLNPAELRQLLVRSNDYIERGESYAERVERQAAMSFSRDGWSEDFPDVVLGHKLGTMREHPDYAAAKAGDDLAALRVARDTVTKDFSDRVKAAIPEGSTPAIVPVVAREATGDNRIPVMAAEVLGKRLGLEVDHGLVQAEKVGRGAGDAMHRLSNQPTFEGKVTPGKDYLLLDDTLTQGGTLAQLKTHIEREGGKVVLATSLTGKDYSRKLSLDPTTLGNVRDRFGRIEGWWRRQFGHGFDGLTESEARTILTYDRGRLTPDGLRDRVLARRIPGLGDVGEGTAGDRPGTQAPGAGGRDETGAVKGTPPKPRRDFSLDDRGEREEPGSTRRPFSKASASIESMNEVMPKLDDGAFQRAKEWAKGKLLDFEPHLLGALQLRHVLELASDTKVLKRHADFYADTFQRMDADRNTMTMEGVAKADRLNKWAFERGPAGWAGKLTEEAKALFKFMHEVTQVTVDPTSEYERLLMRDDRGEQTPWTEDLRKQRIKVLQEQMRGRAGDDKTALLDQIKDLRKLPAREKARELKYPEQVAKWNALSPHAKEMFTMMRDHYRETSERLEEATLARIQALDIPEQNKRAASQMVRTNFADNKVGGVYFPLARFGDYWIASRLPGEDGEGGEYHFTKYEDAYAAQRAEKKLLAAGHTIEATGRQNKDYETQKPVTGTFMGQLTGMLRQGGAPDKVLDDIHQMFLRTLPELSLRKSGIHRSNVAGYTDNVPRIFASNVLHGAHQIARARYGYQLEDSMEHMRGTVEGNRPGMAVGQAAHADALVGELAKRHQWIMNPTNSKLATMINSVGFTYYLSASPASALVNLSQGAMVTLPVLGARHGWPAAMREMGSATRDAMRTFGNIRKVLNTDDERRAFDTLEANGTFARTATHSLGGIAEGDALKMNPAYAKVMTAMGYMFQKAEVINRESAGIAAFRLATKDGKSFNEAIKYADQIVNGTHFDYSNANRSRWMQGNVQKVLFQFKNYALGMSWVLYRNLEQSLRGETPEVRRVARRTLTGVLGMTSLFAGVMGTPINNLLSAGANAYHAATGDDDTPWDFNTEFRGWLSDHLGARAASVIADGVVDQLGANVSGRVGTSDLWFREPDRQLEGGPAYDQFLESIAGPIGGLTKNLFVGSNMVSQGHTERGVETMMPTFIKNAMKSVRFANEGVNNLRGDPIVPDVSGPEKLIQALGFQPTKIAEQQRVNSAMMNYQKAVQDRRQSLMNAFAMATSSGDGGQRTEALTKIRAFNQKYPEISIGVGNLQSSLRRRAQQSAQADSGILLNRKLAPRIRAAVGESRSE